MLTALATLSPSAGCEVLLSMKPGRSTQKVWAEVDLENDLSVEYRILIQEQLDALGALDLDLLAYDAVVTNELVGVAYAKEIESFLNELPARGSAQKFKGDQSQFSKMTQRCVRISMGPYGTVTSFGPATFNDLVKYSSGRIPVLFSPAQEVKRAPDGLLSLGAKTSFVVYKDFVFVVDNANSASITEFRAVVFERAKTALEKLKKLPFVKFEDFGGLQNLVQSSPGFAQKISASDARGVFDRMTIDGLRKSIQEFTSDLKFKDNGKTITLSPDWSKSSDKKQMEKLFRGVFAYCALTGDKVEALIQVPARKGK
jgi:hypothetical protein